MKTSRRGLLFTTVSFTRLINVPELSKYHKMKTSKRGVLFTKVSLYRSINVIEPSECLKTKSLCLQFNLRVQMSLLGYCARLCDLENNSSNEENSLCINYTHQQFDQKWILLCIFPRKYIFIGEMSQHLRAFFQEKLLFLQGEF